MRLGRYYIIMFFHFELCKLFAPFFCYRYENAGRAARGRFLAGGGGNFEFIFIFSPISIKNHFKNIKKSFIM